MPVVSKSIRIEAAVERVFERVTDPDNWIRYVTSLVDVSDRSPDLPAEGSTFSWKYKMMGFTFGGRGTVSVNRRNEAFGIALESKFPIKESYEFKDMGGGFTELSVTIDYEMPAPMKALFEGTAVIEKMNDIEATGVLEKIRALCEAR
jgi:hypothetical protein